ncbi:hypothetical protein PQX77_008680 [Marasmius sp. AFHP31]|nr:hypothetical protein PQX77_008680 [Marasmius sp. AFHP31]
MTSNTNSPLNSSIPTSIQSPYRGFITKSDRQIISHHILDTEQELKAFDTRLKKLNTEINRLRGAVILVETRREMVDKKLANYRSLLSPIHRMPPEIMTEIFKLCCSYSSLGTYRLCSPSYLPPPMMLSSVCGRWRELALNTPALWASLFIYETLSSPDTRVYSGAKLFMDRSKSAPLTINAEYEGPPSHGRDFFEPLIQNSRRWACLDLSIEASNLEARMFHSLRDQVPLLKHLGLRASSPIPPPTVGQTALLATSELAAFELAPSLQSLTLAGHLVTPRLVLPWRQIKTLELDSTVIDALLPILRQCCTVEQITLRWINGSSLHTGSYVLLPSAGEISINVSIAYVDALSSILEHLTLPGLKSMKLQTFRFAERHSPWDGVPTLREFFIRSSCSLTSLCLRYVPMDDKSLLSLLPLIPALTTLTIVGNGETGSGTGTKMITNHFLARLSLYRETVGGFGTDRNRSADMLIPHLKDLSLVIDDFEGLDEQLLVSALASRLPDTSRMLLGAEGMEHDTPALDGCLGSIGITLKVQSEYSFDALLSMECFRDAGVKVEIRVIRLLETSVDSSEESGEESDEEDK